MRLSRLALLLTGCAVMALTAPAAAQEVPVIIDPPLAPQVGQPPVVIPVPGVDAVEPHELLPPLVVPADDPPAPPEEAVAPPIPAIWAPVPVDDQGRSAYGLYLSGRLANIRGDRTEGAALLAKAQALAPEQPSVTEEAYMFGLFSGDLEAVRRLRPAVRDNPLFSEAGRMVELVESFARGDSRASLAQLRAQPFIEPYGDAVRYLAPSIAAAAGDWDSALAPVDAPATHIAGLILRQQRAWLLEARRRHGEAEAEYGILMAMPAGARLFGLNYAEFLERQGRGDEALPVYDAFLATPLSDSRAALGRARISNRKAPPSAPTFLENASEALMFAALQNSQFAIQAERPDLNRLSTIYLRLAERLHPADAITLQLGESLSVAGDVGPARAAFSRVSRTDPLMYARAQVYLAQGLAADGQNDAAFDAFRRADAAARAEPAFALALANHLNNVGRHEESLTVLDRPSLNAAQQPADVRFERGRALEGLGRLDAAENELWAALQTVPDNPTLLNYLGYMWVDSGRRVDQGAEMLARAHAADPENGNIQDSLGWAQFRQGRYEAAVETLEGAVNKEPANAEIVDHLGDAYWQVGRRREAEWQWSRVLTLDPDAERRAEVEQKLVRGLTAPAPAPAPVSASQP
ncbi:MAG: tetratricopeptide repeat protein [Brevundimonas sp.]|uniref:tetratricopeptide repeat protein n=1 Tax=Brevundimonas sp. TaxID=1871086 RepID=UPI002AB825D5|nr:tetratricopeptide repeat protein [Brevundimonas sp.]MDZ4108559.1 tetratricopeptide repeat protein [Brevundimonas sp.]